MIGSWIASSNLDKSPAVGQDICGYLFLFGAEDEKALQKVFAAHSLSWQKASMSDPKKPVRDVMSFVGKKGPVWIVRQKKTPSAVSHEGLLEDSAYSFFRDQVGAMVSTFKAQQLKKLFVEFSGTSSEQELGALTGLEIAAYNYRDLMEARAFNGLPDIYIKRTRGEFDRGILKEAQARARAVNLARHFVNMPPNQLNPTTYPALVRRMKFPKAMQVSVWDMARLKKEGMGLHVGVGQGAENPPCLVHLRWRPAGSRGVGKSSAAKTSMKKTSAKKTSAKSAALSAGDEISSAPLKLRPIAFVGKGITFDTGGLDIKPSAGMRLMKKDMGGSAAVLGIAQWAAESNYPGPLDFYLALAENAVDANAFRPSDVCVARNGMKVEIDNTDAEGRLVLADALDVAVTQKGADEPETVIDIATLTGAIKVALGADIAGLFTNDDLLSNALARAGQAAGDLNWRMPLMERYWAGLASNFADCKNSADGFGGAITAALFLSKFVRSKSWAHLDIYAWSDKGIGPLTAGSGSGQAVQAMIEWLETRIR